MAADDEVKTIRELLDRMSEWHPESIFLISPETGRSIAFRALQEQARLVSIELLQAGLKPGDKVAFLLDNGLFTAQLFLGAMYGGFVVVPLNTRAGVSQLAYTLGHCDAQLVYVSEEYDRLIHEVLSEVGRAVRVIPADVDGAVEATAGVVDVPELAPPSPEDPALLMYTSGSTGQPKAAVHSHRTILSGARNSIASHQLTQTDRSLLLLPLYHINAECVTLIPTLLSGGSVVAPHRFSVSHFWDWLEEYRCTWSAVVPTIISQLLDWQDPRADTRLDRLQHVRFLRSSSAPLAPSLHREFLDKFGLLLIQAMGSSEAGNIFSNPLPPAENKIGSPGLPWGFEVRIVDRAGVEVPTGEPGEVEIRGPAIMQGYYKQPEETAAVLDTEGWLHTGDLAYRDGDGYLFVVGRSKELIIKGGVNIAPRQIDDVLESHPAVLEAACVGIPDHYLGEDLVAFVVLRAGAGCSENELLRHCEKHLGQFKTPTRVYFASDLPKGPSGKVQRLRLRDDVALAGFSEIPHANGHAPHNGSRFSESVVEQLIAESWAEVLSVPRVELDSNFFALGGHSLLAAECVSRLRETIPVALSLSDFFENATVAHQAALVRRRLHEEDRSSGAVTESYPAQPIERALQNISSSITPSTIPPRDRNLPCPLSPGQRRLWFMEQMHPGLAVYNESEAVRLLGHLNVEALERSLNVIVARHEILRTTIDAIDGEPIATIHESLPIQIGKIDLSELSGSVRQAEVERLLVDEPRRLYDFQTQAGIRLTLLRLGPEEHVLILMMHHIICDWSSEGVVWRELSVLYRSLVRDEEPALPPLPVQFGDFAAWQVKQYSEADFEDDLAYWEQNLSGAPQLLELPADRTRPPTLSYRGARKRISLDPALTAELREVSQRAGVTQFTLFAAALTVLLYRYTGNEDILLGIPVANRDRKDLQPLIGFLLFVQVLRSEVSGDMTFRELLARVQKNALGLYLHRAVPFDQVVRRLQPERNLSYSPLFQVMLIWRDRDQLLPFIGLEGLTVESLLSESGTSKFDLTLFVTDCGDQVWLDIEYSTDLFDEDRIQRMLGHYATLLESVAQDSDGRLDELPILTTRERAQLLEWNQTETAYPSDRMLDELIEEQVERSPDSVAVLFEDRRLTYRELDDRANRLARYLQACGVGPGALVGICVERSLEMLVGLLGILKSGGAYVPLDPAYPTERLSFMIEDCRPRVLVTVDSLQARIPAHNARVICLDAPFDWTEEWNLRRAARQASDLAYLLYTSGSTGKPNGVEIPHRAFVNLLTAMRRSPGLNPGDKLLAVTTPSFDIAGLELFLPLISGACVVIAGQETIADGARLSSLMKRRAVTVMQATPSTWRILVEAGWKGSSELKVLCGGEPWSSELAEALLPRCKTLWNMYGPTETTIWSSATRIESGGRVLIGSPIANTTFYVLDRHRQLVPIGVPGELYIGGQGVARGYFNRPDLTKERFLTDPLCRERQGRMYKTGDSVRRLASGAIEFLNRIDQQVKLRGFRIELGEIEAVLKQHPEVDQCVALVREDSGTEKRLTAYIVLSDPRGELRTLELRDFVKSKLPEYMVPGVFIALARFPLTPNGKIDRKALTAAKYAPSEFAAAQPSGAPATVTELLVSKIWERTLDVGTIGAQDNFFDLGGHSLLAVQLVNEINKTLHASLTLRIFLVMPTIAGIAKVLQSGKFTKSGPHLIPLRETGSNGAIFFLDASMAMCRLAQLLDVELDLFATEAPLSPAAYRAALLNMKAALPCIEELAVPHVKLIRSAPFSGPCLLAGHSFNGLLAFEVAHQLYREGTSVEMILLMDAWIKTPPLWDRLRLLSFSQARNALINRVERLCSTAFRRIDGIVRGSYSAHGADSASFRPLVELQWVVRERVYNKARSGGQWLPLECRGVLFRSRDKRMDRFSAADRAIGWEGLFAGGLEVRVTPGDHLSLLEEPQINVLADKVNDCLAHYRTKAMRVAAH